MTIKPVRFLLIEDEEDHAELLRLALLNSHVANVVERVSDGAHALQYLRLEGDYVQASLPDVVLLDLKLPKVDGMTILAEIKSKLEFRNILVVILSTSSSRSDRARAAAQSADHYMTKPVTFEKIHQMVLALNLTWHIAFQPPNSEN